MSVPSKFIQKVDRYGLKKSDEANVRVDRNAHMSENTAIKEILS